jgi:glycosyltransferase involved in cell wall biosynthesis
MESHSVTLATALLKKKQTVYLACPAGSPMERNALAHSVPVIDLSIINSADIKAIFKMKKILRLTAADILIVNLGKDYWPATIAAKIAGKKIVLIRHQANRLKKVTRWLVSNHVDRIVAVSRFIKDGMVDYGIPSEKIQVIYNAVDFRAFTSLYSDREQVRKEVGIKADDIVIGFVGAMTEGKGIFELFNAFYLLASRNPRLKLLYVGKGPEMEDLKKETRVLEGRVIFVGQRRDVVRMYAAMDIFVLPSTCREAFGTVIIEAMSMGKPVIATHVGGVPEIIEHGTNGLIVPPGDSSALARAMWELIEVPSFREKLALNAIDSVSLRFSEDVFGDSFVSLIKGVCGPPQSLLTARS